MKSCTVIGSRAYACMEDTAQTCLGVYIEDTEQTCLGIVPSEGTSGI